MRRDIPHHDQSENKSTNDSILTASVTHDREGGTLTVRTYFTNPQILELDKTIAEQVKTIENLEKEIKQQDSIIYEKKQQIASLKKEDNGTSSVLPQAIEEITEIISNLNTNEKEI